MKVSHLHHTRLQNAFQLIAASILLMAAPMLSAQAATKPESVSAQPPYSVVLFATPPAQTSAPDSVAFNSTNIYIGYGNNGSPGGQTPIPSTIIKYDYHGNIVNQTNVRGHNDGLKVNPQSGDLWALENEDGNSLLLILNPQSLAVMTSYFLGTGPHGGGYDDIVFLNGNVYFSCSNPTRNPNNEPAIVQFTVNGSQFTLTPVLLGNAQAIDIPTGQQVTLNLQDPDSMKYNLGGDIVLDSQGDGELVVVHNPGNSQIVSRVLLTVNGQMITVDDTVFPSSSNGFLIVSDTGGNPLYKITAPFFQPGSPISASDTGGFVGTLNFETGVLTPAVTGMVSPHGMEFIPQP